ncbi:hypothetical protein DAPPUDRAFT_241408 [Daphnia pulex]|uniref:Uncharacterized protein n=1 Tax=Daphnia pulex TaxID=6669 RepID=E9GE71_DAPPU|nr:hypothetical protein DAPPUDRAFT_241408 [Daphnia pulex]|eukprot:EFX82364.1 hypothetical protein DAPPUDRAFT_241408 [Daphnia pulex]
MSIDPSPATSTYRKVSMAFKLEGHGDNYTHPQQSHLQKERPVCISIEGHGDHFVKGVTQWCRGWVRTGRFASLSRRRIPNRTPPPYYTTIYATTSYYTEVALSGLHLNHQGSRLLHHNLCCSSSYTTKTLKYYTIMASETTQLRMLPQPTTPRLQLIAPPKLSNTTLERPSTIEVSRVSFSDTQHGSPEVSNNLRFKQWNDKE